MKLKCPKCLMAESEAARVAGKNTQLLNQKLSIVCNASPVAPCDDDPCCCGADWIPAQGVAQGVAMAYQLCWKMRGSSIVRAVESMTLEDLALVYHGLITRQVQMETLELKLWMESSRRYTPFPFPANWKEIIKRATYGGAKFLKCPVCGHVDSIEKSVIGTCELCRAHGGSAPQMEPFTPPEVKSYETRIPATSPQV